MEPDKVGKLIQEIRKKNNLTQKDLADLLCVSDKAVSKWERGLNLPDISILQKLSDEFNISIEKILNGEFKEKDSERKKYLNWLLLLIPILLVAIIFLIINNDNNIEFKEISANCSNFEVTGVMAYNKDKTSIYISSVNYCGDEEKKEYNKINCNLYENNGDNLKIIEKCEEEKNINIEEYIKNITFHVDNYQSSCKKYTSDTFYLEINAEDDNGNITSYKIPLKLLDNCDKKVVLD